MKTTCKCEHWQICPMCKPEWHNPDLTQKPPTPKVQFQDGVGAMRKSPEDCHEGVAIVHIGNRIYWPMTDKEQAAYISAACGRAEFEPEKANAHIYQLQEQIAKDTARIAVLEDALRELAEEFDWHDPRVAKAQGLLGETA